MTTEKHVRGPGDPTEVGHGIDARNAGWSFGGDTARTFSQHVAQSVPLYEEGHELVCVISDFFLRDGSTCYELGTSTGMLLEKLARRHQTRKEVRFIGIDIQAGMIEVAREACKGIPSVSLEVADITKYDFELSDLIVAYYTMQFVPPRIRQDVFNAVWKALNWGGGFILFEKVRAPDPRFQDMATTIYSMDWKLKQGFTPEEIVAKHRSLKGVLEPFSTQGNFDLLKRAGFVDMMTVQKWVCFEGFLAIK